MTDVAAHSADPPAETGQDPFVPLEITESREPSKRQRSKSWKALQNAIQAKTQELWDQANTLHNLSNDIYDTPDNMDVLKAILHSSRTALATFERTLGELESLYREDKWGDSKEDARFTRDYSQKKIEYAHNAIKEATDRLASLRNEVASLISRSSRKTTPSKASTSSSTARRKAMADAAAAREQAEYDRAIAEKEIQSRMFEAEEERKREQRRAQHNYDVAVLAAQRAAAMADAKLNAIEKAIREDERANGPFKSEGSDSRHRTEQWVRTQGLPEKPLERPHRVSGTREPRDLSSHHEDKDRYYAIPAATGGHEADIGLRNFAAVSKGEFGNVKTEVGQSADEPNFLLPEYKTFVPRDNHIGVHPSYRLTAPDATAAMQTNHQLAATLARQSLPKCHPDIFDGDATLFHPWKAAFKAMIQDARLTPDQEMNYLRSYTKGNPQIVVDNYRRRRYQDPSQGIKEVWGELERRFGNAATITQAFLARLGKTAKFDEKDADKLQVFADLCSDIDGQSSYLTGLQCLDFASVIQPIVEKLPKYLLSKWHRKVVRYAEKHQDGYPGFHEFTILMEDQARLKNHPHVLATTHSFQMEKESFGGQARRARVLKSDTTSPTPAGSGTPSAPVETKYCVFHERKTHDLCECKAFSRKTLEEKSDWIKKAGLCFRCQSSQHRAKDCKAAVICGNCGSERHPTFLHKEKPRPNHGEELQSTCTTVCHNRGGISCSKTVLADVFPQDRPDQAHRVYVIIDDQSNASMISPQLADTMGVTGKKEKYLLSTCSEEKEVKYGRRVTGICVKSLDGNTFKLPTLVECSHIPQDKEEIPTPEIAARFPHLRELAKQIPPIDSNAKIQILIGRDAPELMKVRAFKNGPKGAPWAQRLVLGWTISGQVCLDRIGGPVHLTTRHTSVEQAAIAADAVDYEVVPCKNRFQIRETYGDSPHRKESTDIFQTTENDNETTLSQEDRRFLNIMERSARKNEQGNWETPLPFRSSDVKMPNNRCQAANRLKSLLKTFKRKPQLEKDYLEFMEKIFERGHATQVPPEELTADQENNRPGRVWYLPHFGVYHHKKPGQIRVVFDSSAEFQGVSLNKELLSGPDQMNSLLGVLIRFRQEEVALMCDVEQMFYSFHVTPSHRDFQRFLWFKNNDPSEGIVEYRMNVHIFGNVSSPAIATYGMRRTAEDGEEEFGSSVKDFVHKDFYVDDGLTSRPTDEEVSTLIKKTQLMLATAHLRLHKVISNSIAVMEALPREDRGKNVRDLDLRKDSLPTQRSLGVHWELEGDNFTFRVALPERPYTRRGVLAIINSVYDPLGLATPVILRGKLLFRQLVALGSKDNDPPLGWDDPLPQELARKWLFWKDALVALEQVRVPRCYHPEDFGRVIRSEIHVFSDASNEGIGVASYLKQVNESGEVSVAFLFGQTKLAPLKPTSIPRLELCGAVLSSKAAKKLSQEIAIPIHEVVLYTDSKVTLGYIKSDSRRFYTYVANRVQMIRNTSDPSQWRYVGTSANPADLATRGVPAHNLKDSMWLNGPEFLRSSSPNSKLTTLEVVLDEEDPEVRKPVITRVTGVHAAQALGSERFSRFSSFVSLRRGLANLLVKIKEFKAIRGSRRFGTRTEETSHRDPKQKSPMQKAYPGLTRHPTTEELDHAQIIMVKAVQKDVFTDDLVLAGEVGDPPDIEDRIHIRQRKHALKSSNLHNLDPFLDAQGILRVGGRLRRSNLDFPEKHPILLPKQHHLSHLVVRHYHERVHHQGRQITHGAVRTAGFWIVGGHSVVQKVIGSCSTCKRLRGANLTQHMADLPTDRTETPPPFTNVGCDVFGPWTITTRKLRGGSINSKRWGLVLTCLNSRAIHIEVLESMDTSSFISALRRFFAIRGPAARMRCDRGSNFIGAKSELDRSLQEMDEGALKAYLSDQGCQWSFNPPHASHFGGVWERQIGTIRRVLDAMLLELGKPQLTHELLVTLLAEVSAIVNSRPITTIPSDVEEPLPLSPAMLLTQKTRPLLPPPGSFTPHDFLYARRRWRRSHYLADQFWVRWRKEYLQSLQRRPKWTEREHNLAAGDVVLVKDKEAHRNDWQLGRVLEAIPSEDGRVRKANVLMWKEGARKTYLRPISELVLIVRA